MKSVGEVYEEIYKKNDYLDTMPEWLRPHHDIEWAIFDRMFRDLIWKQHQADERVKVLDIGCGMGTLVRQCLEDFTSRPHLDVHFADKAYTAITKSSSLWSSIKGDDDNSKGIIFDINLKASWQNLPIHYNIATCMGTTSHVDNLLHFMERVSFKANYTIISFMRNDTMMSRLLADHDFIKEGLVYNIWNEEFILDCINRAHWNIIDRESTELSHLFCLGRL